MKVDKLGKEFYKANEKNDVETMKQIMTPTRPATSSAGSLCTAPYALTNLGWAKK